MKKIILLLTVLMGLIISGYSVEINLDNSVPGPDEKSAAVVGYVDIETLFSVHPMTARLKEEFYKEADKRKEAVADLKKEALSLEKVYISSTTEINDLKNEIDALRKECAKKAGESPESAAEVKKINDEINKKAAEVSAKEKGMEVLSAEMEKKKKEIIEMKKMHKDELERLEDKDTEIVMADLYLVIEEVAKEEGINVILDKNNILYGKSAKNITNKVKQRLQGR